MRKNMEMIAVAICEDRTERDALVERLRLASIEPTVSDLSVAVDYDLPIDRLQHSANIMNVITDAFERTGNHSIMYLAN